ncbi:MAG TPA: matrixin family metalloprotease, partial [Pirellulales bacterium]|nr:matrixin family metalloprotease [Pirellulales bacterium]
MLNRIRREVERLEERDCPATWGVAWADPTHMTMSFAPDGTSVGGSPSVLFQTMAADGLTSVANWETQVVRAIQTWLVNTNISVGIVKDGGEALGSAGAAQGDSRFGDIRIAARPLSSGAVAEASPFTWSGSTWSGDIVLNSNYKFGIGNSTNFYDIFSVALHEAGHAFGIDGNTTDPTSAMYETYQFLTGLDSADIAAIQSLYGGARAPDQYAAASPNHTLGTATPIGLAVSNMVEGDVTTMGDVEYYSFT